MTDEVYSLTSGGGKPGQGYPAVVTLALNLRGREEGARPELIMRSSPSVGCERDQRTA